MKLEELKPSNVYMTMYNIIGRRENGSYVVRAKSKKEANAVVRKINPDYTRISSVEVKKFFGSDYDQYEKEEFEKKILPKLKKDGDKVHWEEGT